MEKRALISVSNKQGLEQFAYLAAAGWEILSTGGTAQELRRLNVPVIDVAEYTGFPEMMNGRLKTLHPKVHGGILADRFEPEHVLVCEKQGIGMIDLVVVNLYPFEDTVAKPNCTVEMAVEQIDIGGPTMVRSAAKNWKSVTVLVHPADYAETVAMLAAGVPISQDRRRWLAMKAFRHTANYDHRIASWFEMKEHTGWQ